MNPHVTMDGIVFETQRFGGISRMHFELLSRLCDADSSARVSVFANRFAADRIPSSACVEHVPIRSPERYMRPGRLFLKAHLRARRVFAQGRLRERKETIWHSSYYTLPTSWDGPIVTTVYDMIHERFSDLFTLRSDEVMRQRKRDCVTSSDLVIAISEATKQDVVQQYGFRAELVRVVHLDAGSAFRAKTEDQSPASPPYLLYVGGRAHYKNPQLLLSTYARWNRRQDVRLVFAGPPVTNQERRLVESLGISHQVDFVSNPDDQLLGSLYQNAQAMIYPSLYEGFGIPLVEAMRSGCPIVASRIPSSLEVAEDAAIYFETREGESLLRSLDAVLEPEVRRSLVIRGLERARQFSWKLSARKLCEAYRSL